MTPSLDNFKELFVVMEYVKADLKKVLSSPQKMSPNVVKTILYNILVGIFFIHSAGVLH